MQRAVTLFVLLFALWLALSGHYEPFVMALGLLSCILVVSLTRRMRIVDEEGLPLNMMPGLVGYIPWLCWAIIKANIDVARRVVHPRLPIDPVLIRVSARQRTVCGRVAYANSITLTPGTISLDVTKTEIEVHALSTEAARDLQSGEMERRVVAMEPR